MRLTSMLRLYADVAYGFADMRRALQIRMGRFCVVGGWVDRYVCWLGVERTWLAEQVRNRLQGIDGEMNLVQVGLRGGNNV